jgi:hypothetical protein
VPLALRLALEPALGRRCRPACVFDVEGLQPRFGEGPLDDARPPGFANIVARSVGAEPIRTSRGCGRGRPLLVSGVR